MEFRILGPIDVVRDGRSIDLGSPKQRAILALLVIHAGRTLTIDRILDEIWGAAADGKEKALWVYVSRLRSVLEPDRPVRGPSSVLVTRGHGYELTVARESIDSCRFEQSVETGRRQLDRDPAAASATLTAALELWRGPALQDVARERFAESEAHRLDQLRLDATADRIEADLRSGRAQAVTGELGALHRAHPLREDFVAQLMLAFYRTGRHVDALSTYRQFRRRLLDEAGLDPSPGLERLVERILVHDGRLAEPAHVMAWSPGVVDNPYRGLRAFRPQDVAFFHGRERLVADVVGRVASGASIVALVGPSGSGKSSILGAGVVPAVEDLGDEPSSWVVAWMVPGRQPFAELESALLSVGSAEAGEDLGALLADPTAGAVAAASAVLPDGARLLLVIDQFEELFSLVAERAVSDRFLDELVRLVDDSGGRVVVALALRADFYAGPIAHPAFGSRLGDGVVNVVPLRPSELESAAHRPAAQLGIHLEPALLASVVADVAGRPGGLPLFQFALTELFEARSGDVLTMASYEAMGGVAGAVAARAEDLFDHLTTVEKAVVRQLFLRLVAISPNDAWTRRRAHVGELTGLEVDVVALDRVIDQYSRYRLLTLDRDQRGAPTVEIAHEALLMGWPRLREWVEQAREDIRRHALLVSAMDEWRLAERDPGYLLSGTRLGDVEQWAATEAMRLTAAERAYVEESLHVRDRALQVEDDRRRTAARLAASARRRLVAVAALGTAFLTLGVVLLVSVVEAHPRVLALVPAGSEVWQTQVETGLARVADELDVPIEQAQAELMEPHDYAELADGGSDFLFVAPTSMADDLERFTSAHPQTVVAVVGSDDPTPGVRSVTFADEHAGYLAGIAAATTSQSGVVGFVGDMQNHANQRLRAGFEAGARRVDQEVTVLAGYLGEPGHGTSLRILRANRLADTLYEDGADVVLASAGDASIGVFESTLDHTLLTGSEVWAIGAGSDWRTTAPSHLTEYIRASVERRWDVAVVEAVRAMLDADRTEDVRLDARHGVFSVRTDGTPSIDAAIDAARTDIARGRVTVPTVPTEQPLAPPDLRVVDLGTASWDGDSCHGDLEGPRFTPATAFRIEFVNRSATAHAVEVLHQRSGRRLVVMAAPGERARGYTRALAGDFRVACRPIGSGDLIEPAAVLDVER